MLNTHLILPPRSKIFHWTFIAKIHSLCGTYKYSIDTLNHFLTCSMFIKIKCLMFMLKKNTIGIKHITQSPVIGCMYVCMYV